MEFLSFFDIWDIIWFCSLVVWIIGLILVKPIYRHFNSMKIENHTNNSNFGNVNVNSWNSTFNNTIIENVTINGETTNLDNNCKING